MNLLPIIIIVSLLGFFIILSLVLFIWQYLKVQEHRRQRTSDIHQRPPRQLTLRSGLAIPKSDAQDTASTRGPPSLDMPSPRTTYIEAYEADVRRLSETRRQIAARDHGHPPILVDVEAQKHINERARKGSSEPPPLRNIPVPETRAISFPPNVLVGTRHGSHTVPRPSLVTIETRRPSAAKSLESQRRRSSGRSSGSKGKESQTRRSSATQGQEITASLQRAYTGPSFLGSVSHDVPSSPVICNDSLHVSDSRMASERRLSERTLESATVSSKDISEAIQRPLPLFSGNDYHMSPHVRFASQVEDVHRISFLSMTESASSSVPSEQFSPVSPMVHAFAPPPSKEQLVYYQKSSPEIMHLSPDIPISPLPLRDTPPQLDTPEFGRTSFFESPTSSQDSKRADRGVSVMSNRSMLTIASSEISSNWTIGNAQLVNIYPSVASERATPPYARRLRSKYGRYPNRRRDKALPVIPKSPLSQSDFGTL